MSLRRYVIGRVLSLVPVLVGVSLLTFAMLHLVPGDAVDIALGLETTASAEEREALRAAYDLDRPLWQQYLLWLTDVLALDLGHSPVSGDVGSTIGGRLPATILLGVLGWTLALCVSIPLGIYAAVNRDRPADDASRVAALVGIATPNFWLGLLLLLVFSLWLGWFPSIPPDRPLWHPSTLWYLVLPAITLGTAAAALLTRILRASMIEELEEGYVTAARAKGLPERTVVLKHVLRNSLVSTVTVAALLGAAIVDGAVVVEVVFSWPGVGESLVTAIRRRDLLLVQGIVLLIGVSIVVANLLADLLYAWLDPRIRYRP